MKQSAMAETSIEAYSAVMRYRIMILSWMLLASFPALACEPQHDGPILSDAQVIQSTKENIKESDAIIDALAIQKRDGGTILKTIKVWKGKRQPSYYIGNARCDIVLMSGTKVRALLIGEDNDWVMIAPKIDRKSSAHLFDRTVDNYLGHSRPRDYENGDLSSVTPPPPRSKR